MGHSIAPASPAQRGSGGAGQQDGAHDVGTAGPSADISTGAREYAGLTAHERVSTNTFTSRLRKGRHDVMAYRSDRDPLNLIAFRDAKSFKETRRGSAHSIRARRHHACIKGRI